MKKTLAAVAVLGAFAGTAMAANVQLYGRIDTGLSYTQTDNKIADKTHKTEMTSGFSTGSRFGLKGAEDIGNGVKVGFVLESGFTSDNGKLNNDGRLFGRESVLTVEGNFGKLYAGRIGSIMSDAGSISLLGNTSVFGTSYGIATAAGSTGSAWARHDNVIAYVTPVAGGLQFSAMYSTKSNDEKDKGGENKAEANRYFAAGLKLANGPLTAVAAFDYTIKGHTAHQDPDNGFSMVVGGNVALDVATIYGKVAYFKDQDGIKDTFDKFLTQNVAFDGYGVEFGAKVPVAGGNVLAGVGYRSAEVSNDSADEYTRWNVGVGYTYAFSKRTNVYGIVNYAQEESDKQDETAKAYQVGVGLVHKF